MQLFRELIALLARTPAWVPLILCPALLVAAAVLVTLLGGRRAYPVFAVLFGGAGAVLLACLGTVAETLVYLGLYAVLAALLRCLLFLPRPRRADRSTSRDERIYKQFRGEPLRALPAQE